ncbi:MAG TPA: helix-turn-helix domain-containing protein [Anaerolineae bacterium]|nr:helix-turn-helix domain-containing protein [Anaerolineae bacterium]
MPTHREIEAELFRNFGCGLCGPDASLVRIDGPEPAADLAAVLSVGQNRITILAEIESSGKPSRIRGTIAQLQQYAAQHPDCLPVLIVPYLGEIGRHMCKAQGIGYVDLAGNCYLRWNTVYIDRVGNGAPPSMPKRASSLFSDKASLVIKFALDNLGRPLRVRELARQLSLSPAWVSEVLQSLISAGYAARVGDGTVVSRPLDLLNDWAESYSFARRNDLRPFFNPAASPDQVIARLASLSTGAVPRYALTLHAGASLVAAFSQYHEVHIYVDPSDRREETERVWREALDLQPVQTGGNFYLTWPYYKEGVFYDSREIDGVWVASDVQLYVDLYNYPIRGREQAEYLMRRRLAHLRSQG